MTKVAPNDHERSQEGDLPQIGYHGGEEVPARGAAASEAAAGGQGVLDQVTSEPEGPPGEDQLGFNEEDDIKAYIPKLRAAIRKAQADGCWQMGDEAEFSIRIFIRELLYHLLYPFSILPIVLLEGRDGLRRREFLFILPGAPPRTVFSMAIVNNGRYLAYWLCVLLYCLHYRQADADLVQIDFFYMMTGQVLNFAAVARKYACWSERATRYHCSSFQAKRSQEMMRWLQWQPTVLTPLIVSSIFKARLERLAPLLVFVQKEEKSSCYGAEELIETLAPPLPGVPVAVAGSTTPEIYQTLNPVLTVTSRLLFKDVDGSATDANDGEVRSPTMREGMGAFSSTAQMPPGVACSLDKRLPIKGFGTPITIEAPVLFSQLALRVGMTGGRAGRETLKCSLALVSAVLLIVARAVSGKSPLGTIPGTHALTVLSATSQFITFWSFHSSFLEASLVTYMRMLELSKSLVSISTQDPVLLGYLHLKTTAALPYFLPLATNVNVVAWLRLRQAIAIFGASFRARIDFYMLCCVARFLILVVLVVKYLYDMGEMPYVLFALMEWELLVLLVAFVAMLSTGTRISNFTDRSVMQLKRLRVECSSTLSRAPLERKLAANIVDQSTLSYAIDYVETSRVLHGLTLAGVPMTSRGVYSIVVSAVPILSGLYYIGLIYGK